MNNTQGNSSIKLGKGIAAPPFPAFPVTIGAVIKRGLHYGHKRKRVCKKDVDSSEDAKKAQK